MRSKVAAIILFLLLSALSTSLRGQATHQYDLPKGNHSISYLFSLLEADGFIINYSNNFLDKSKEVSISRTPVSLDEVLALICASFDLSYQVLRKEINLKPRQKRTFVINGNVRDQTDGEALMGANILNPQTGEGVTTNAYGFYSLALSEGIHELVVSYIGYKPIKLALNLKKNTSYHIDLIPMVSQLEEVVVSSKSVQEEINNVLTGVNTINMELISDIPFLMGEVDIFQSALLLPGIRNIGEDASGLNVRGGSVDQNLILLDEATIYNSNHFFGLISIFNPDAVKDVTIYKGGMPSAYGGRASSTIHVRQREGNDKEMHVSGGLGLVSGRLLVEGPIIPEKSSFLVSTRSSFLNYLATLSREPGIGNNNNFQDYNAKLNWRPNDRNHLYLSAYFGVDHSSDRIRLDRRWGNRMVTGRWNRVISDRLFSNFTMVYSGYSYRVNNPDGVGAFVETSTLSNFTTKSDFTWYVRPGTTVDFGAGVTFHQLNPGNRFPIEEENDLISPVLIDNETGFENYGYINLHHQFNSQLTLYSGIRIASLLNTGAAEVYSYSPGMPKRIENIIDTTVYKKWQPINLFVIPEPRFSLIYQFGNENTLKGSFTKNSQFLHLVSNTISPSPTDLWKLSDTHIAPIISNQYSVGYGKLYPKKNLEIQLDAYYRDMRNIVEYREGANLALNSNLETEVLQGIGRAYGLELLVRKSSDRFDGWMSYNLSRTERKIDGITPLEQINNGEFYPADFDRTHDFSISGVYRATNRWSFSSNFVFSTGRPITLPDGKYVYEGIVLPSFSRRNEFRLSQYHRLDLSARLEGKKVTSSGRKKKKTDYWVFSIFNVYARKNAYSYIFRQQEGAENTEVVRYSILGTIIPSVTYNFRF